MPNEIFIENLPLKVDASMLINLFKREGRIISCNIDVDKHFSSLGKGYVVFDNPSSAHHAVKIMDGQSFHGGKIKVSLKPNVFDDETMVDNYTKVFVKNIPPLWDDCDLMMEFQKFGEIRAAQISMTKGKSNYFGFVIFNKHPSAKAAVMSKHSYLVVKPYIPKPMRTKTTIPSDTVEDILKRSTQYNNLHVKNIPEDMDDSALEELFERFGTTTSVKIARDPNSGKSLRFGFVCFVSDMDAEEARSAMDGYILNSKPLVVNFYQKKEARKQYLEKMISDNGGCVEKYIGRREKDFEEKGLERKEKSVEKKEKGVERIEKSIEKRGIEGKEKGAERSGRKGKDFEEKGLERKEKSMEKKEKGIERIEKGIEKRGIEGKEKGTERKEKSTKRKKNKDKMKKETCSLKP